MRVLSCLIESALVEAIQPAQWDKAMRVIGDFNPTFDVDDVITDLALADPTVSSRVEPPYSQEDVMKGKYTGWLLKQLVALYRDLRQAEWIRNNPEKAREQGIIRGTHQADSFAMTLANNAQATHKWHNRVGKVHDALAAFDRIKQIGRMDEFNIPSDLNQVDVYDLLERLEGLDAALIASKRDIKRGKVDPFEFEGSEVIDRGEEHVLVAAITPLAARFHARDTEWCFRGTDYSEEYTAHGPLYILYTRGQAAEELGGVPAEVAEGYFKSLAMSPFSSTGSPDFSGSTEGDVLWEIRDADDDWFGKPALLASLGILDSLDKAVEHAEEYSTPTAVGYAAWCDRGTYDYDDVEGEAGIEVPYSEYAGEFMREFDLNPAEIDADGDISISHLLKRHGIVGQANARYLHHQYDAITRFGSSYYVNVREWNWDMWVELAKAAQGQLLDGAIDELAEFESQAQYDDWLANAGRVRSALERKVLDAVDEDRIPEEFAVDVIDEIRNSTNDLYSELLSNVWEQGYVEWEFAQDGEATIDWDEVVNAIELEDIFSFAGLEEPDEEDEEVFARQSTQTESRGVLRRILLGRWQ